MSEMVERWRPIDTVPKDGREVWLAWRPLDHTEYSAITRWSKSSNRWVGGWCDATHWRPLAALSPKGDGK